MGIILDLLEYIPWQKKGRNILEKVEKILQNGNNLGRHSPSRLEQSPPAVVLGLNSGERATYL
jgi:hypothetical protein